MRASFRHLVCQFALLVFVASIIAPVLPASHQVLDADVELGGAAFLGSRAVPQIAPVGDSTGPEHCPACHLLRALGGADPAHVASAAPGTAALELYSFPLDGRRDHRATGEGPSRAPPAPLSA
jgi:hypothetical protein